MASENVFQARVYACHLKDREIYFELMPKMNYNLLSSLKTRIFMISNNLKIFKGFYLFLNSFFSYCIFFFFFKSSFLSFYEYWTFFLDYSSYWKMYLAYIIPTIYEIILCFKIALTKCRGNIVLGVKFFKLRFYNY